jgi:hypothetical protein
MRRAPCGRRPAATLPTADGEVVDRASFGPHDRRELILVTGEVVDRECFRSEPQLERS